jgi:peptide/nickel transport system substrate-binding protein
VKYKEYYAPYLTRFAPVLPKHILGKLDNMNDAPYNRMPVGTGAFRVTEWVSGDHITMVKNPHYREADKVKIDKLFFKIIPSREVGIAQIQAGDVDGVWDLIEAQIPMMEKNPEVSLSLSNALVSERLIMNHSTPFPPNNGNPDHPHPILADLRVRQAIQYAIDKDTIIDKLLYGKARPGTTEIPDGWAHNPDVKPTEYDPEKAKQLLEAAGWKPGADGIREKDGTRLRLKITTTTGNKLREMVEQVLVAQMKVVGIEFYIENVPSSVLFGSWSNDADRKKGRYDILMYTTGPGIDPHQQYEGYFHSKNIPTEANGGSGYNYTRHRDAELDKWLDLAGKPPALKSGPRPIARPRRGRPRSFRISTCIDGSTCMPSATTSRVGYPTVTASSMPSPPGMLPTGMSNSGHSTDNILPGCAPRLTRCGAQFNAPVESYSLLVILFRGIKSILILHL